jgi:predicted Holliday junction resolvase-like endonuclease
MLWLLIVALVAVAVLAALVQAASVDGEVEAERARIEMEIRRAERRLHDVASNNFRAMMEQARIHDGNR